LAVRKNPGEKVGPNKKKQPRNVDCELCGLTVQDKFVLQRHVSIDHDFFSVLLHISLS
jgi:hypothetical protein